MKLLWVCVFIALLCRVGAADLQKDAEKLAWSAFATASRVR